MRTISKRNKEKISNQAEKRIWLALMILTTIGLVVVFLYLMYYFTIMTRDFIPYIIFMILFIVLMIFFIVFTYKYNQKRRL